jgi:hypothetical protein
MRPEEIQGGVMWAGDGSDCRSAKSGSRWSSAYSKFAHGLVALLTVIEMGA